MASFCIEALLEKPRLLYQPYRMTFRRCTPGLFVLLLLAGCQRQEAAPSPTPMPKTNTPAASVPGWPPTKAQPKLQTMKFFVGPETVTAELCLTEVQVGTGMMFRKEMAENDGMLFVFSRPHRTSFYMRNTPKRCFSMGALNEADSASPSTRRVSAGSITPSSHNRALA